jgi:hypothetical protein
VEAPVAPEQPEAWLLRTDAGRLWLCESGAAAPADLRAWFPQEHVARRAPAEGRVVD